MGKKKHGAITVKAMLLLIMMSILGGCIRPDLATPTPDPNATPQLAVVNNQPNGFTQQPTGPTSLPIGFQPTPTATFPPQPAVNAAAIELGLPEFGKQAQAGTVQIWQQVNIGSTTIVGYSFRNPSGLSCVGTGISDFTLQLNANCASEPAAIFVGAQGLFLLGGSTPAILIVGQLLIPFEGGNVIITYDSGKIESQSISNAVFLTFTQDISYAQNIQVFDNNGQLVVAQDVPR